MISASVLIDQCRILLKIRSNIRQCMGEILNAVGDTAFIIVVKHLVQLVVNKTTLCA